LTQLRQDRSQNVYLPLAAILAPTSRWGKINFSLGSEELFEGEILLFSLALMRGSGTRWGLDMALEIVAPPV
jgi:hypothetical protein